ncbi:hypothetical protein FGO68_gene2119 [Halteria grandinella]|uniref:Uncharacterized protein n=1 Tax=Halteria grandinella TaxID=5974 RepID=A0A8J8T624_HALGN|nr:hypothetical protein FGO68_gene2119 [Halteria grandinella]
MTEKIFLMAFALMIILICQILKLNSLKQLQTLLISLALIVIIEIQRFLLAIHLLRPIYQISPQLHHFSVNDLAYLYLSRIFLELLPVFFQFLLFRLHIPQLLWPILRELKVLIQIQLVHLLHGEPDLLQECVRAEVAFIARDRFGGAELIDGQLVLLFFDFIGEV